MLVSVGSGDERERGTAIVGTLVGFLIFMILLLLGVQTLLHLYATSAVTAAAEEAAQQVATAGGSPADVPAAQVAAEQSLGTLGSKAAFDWVEVDGQQVTVRIEVQGPDLLPLPAWMARVDRTATVRTERFR